MLQSYISRQISAKIWQMQKAAILWRLSLS